MMTFTGIQYLQIDIANSFGLDDQTWIDRLEWFHDHESYLEQLQDQAEEPAQFFAGVQAYRKAQQGLPTGYMCGLDATASGIQILAAVIGCPTSAEIVNLTPSTTRWDAYTACYRFMVDVLGVNSADIPRKNLKKALMTNFFGSKAVPKSVFGEDTPELAKFYETAMTKLPGATLLKDALIGLWQPDKISHDWTLPDGFEVKIKTIINVEKTATFLGHNYTVIEKQQGTKEKGVSLAANFVHSLDGMVVREMGRRCNFDKAHIDKLRTMDTTSKRSDRPKDIQLLRLLKLAQQHQFFSAVILDYLDEQNFGHLSPTDLTKLHQLLATMERPFRLLAIHDCFKFPANYGNLVRQHYINILAEISDADILSNVAAEITGTYRKAKTQSISHLIRGSEYPLS